MADIDMENGDNLKRKRSNSSSSIAPNAPPSSRRRSISPRSSKADSIKVSDVDPARRAERERQLAARVAAMELEKSDSAKDKAADKEYDAKAEFAKLLSTRSGGVYMPPARLRALQEAAASDKSSQEYQRVSWDALRKSITGIVNRVNVNNIKLIVPELFSENLIRGRGLFARSIMKAQASSLPFTPVFAALVAIINTKLPQVGELVLIRLISQFRRAFKRNDKIVCHSTTTFLAHLVNQAVAHEIIALQILVLLLERPTDDSIEVAVGFMREVGAFLSENSPKANATVYERFRAVLNEGTISHRVQYMIEVLMQVRKDKYKDNPILPEGLDLVEEDEQITHQIQLEEELQVQEGLNIFKLDPNFAENEEKYKSIKNEILGEGSDEESGSEEESSDEDEDELEDHSVEEKEGIEDRTGTNLVNLRRTIYLTIMNALNYEEAVHKLLKVQLSEGEEIEMVNMIIECCSQERSYSTFYGLIGERFSKLNRVWTECFETAFSNYYNTIHRYETNRLRNIARFFGHLFASDSISWVVFECIKISEEDTTSSSRIFVKIMMNEMMESMGLKTLADRFKDEEVKRACQGMFPMDVPKNTRFSINYFTSIGLGVVTEEMRGWLKNAPKLIMEQRRAMLEQESSSSDSDSSTSSSDSDSSSGSSDDSDSDAIDLTRRRKRSFTSPVHRKRPSYPDSDDSRGPSRGRSISRTPPPSRNRRREDTAPRAQRNSSTYHNRDEFEDRSPPRKPNGRNMNRDEPPRRRYPSTSSGSRSPPPRSNHPRARSASRSRSPSRYRSNNGRRTSRSPKRDDRNDYQRYDHASTSRYRDEDQEPDRRRFVPPEKSERRDYGRRR
ncbi:MIF4G-domain-containing protein [Lentinula raphanica]|nr:MIF4G-domain-containing protein [Lentinula raphanica]